MQCPTTIIPFFGDQPFWGERVHARGVGPAPIPVDEFSLKKLVAAINFMLDPKVLLFLIFYFAFSCLKVPWKNSLVGSVFQNPKFWFL